MKKVILGFVLLIGLWATSNAQAKANKEIAVQLVHNNLDGYLLQIQPLDGSLYYQVEINVDGVSQVVPVCQYMTAYLIPAHEGSKVVVRVLNVKSNTLTMYVISTYSKIFDATCWDALHRHPSGGLLYYGGAKTHIT